MNQLYECANNCTLCHTVNTIIPFSLHIMNSEEMLLNRATTTAIHTQICTAIFDVIRNMSPDLWQG